MTFGSGFKICADKRRKCRKHTQRTQYASIGNSIKIMPFLELCNNLLSMANDWQQRFLRIQKKVILRQCFDHAHFGFVQYTGIRRFRNRVQLVIDEIWRYIVICAPDDVRFKHENTEERKRWQSDRELQLHYCCGHVLVWSCALGHSSRMSNEEWR